MMGYAAHRAVTIGMSPLGSVEGVRTAKHCATLYTIQLGLNLVWMPIFFGLKRPIEATGMFFGTAVQTLRPLPPFALTLRPMVGYSGIL
jgi:hypothetical protein